MKTHKQMQAERRMKEAQALRIAKRERFVRKWLRRRGIVLQANNYEEECFRGSMALVSGFYKCGGCTVGIVESCTNCLSVTKPAPFSNDSRCRGIRPKATKIWIIQEDEKLKKPIGKPGIYHIFRKKPVLDSHGHVVPEPNFANMPDFEVVDDLPTIQPAPIITESQPIHMNGWDEPTLGTPGGPTIEIAEAPIPDDVHVPNPIDIMWLNTIISIVHPNQAAELQNAWNQGRLLCDDAHTRLYINTT